MTSYLTSFQTGIGVYFIGDRRLITQARRTDHPSLAIFCGSRYSDSGKTEGKM